MPSSLRSNTHSGPAGRSAVSTAFIGVTNAGRTSADPNLSTRMTAALHVSAR